MSLGLSGIALTYLSFLAPYQFYFKLFAVISLIYTHYRLHSHPVSKGTEIFIWIITILVFLALLLPTILRFLI